MSDYQKTIAIDFDGVIHKYSKGWHDGTCYDEPVEGALESLHRLNRRGYRVAIFTCRAETEEGEIMVQEWLEKWINLKTKELNWSGIAFEVTDKKPKAIAYIDDRGIRFTNWTDVLNYF